MHNLRLRYRLCRGGIILLSTVSHVYTPLLCPAIKCHVLCVILALPWPACHSLPNFIMDFPIDSSFDLNMIRVCEAYQG